jgi:hypothetical protein
MRLHNYATTRPRASRGLEARPTRPRAQRRDPRAPFKRHDGVIPAISDEGVSLRSDTRRGRLDPIPRRIDRPPPAAEAGLAAVLRLSGPQSLGPRAPARRSSSPWTPNRRPRDPRVRAPSERRRATSRRTTALPGRPPGACMRVVSPSAADDAQRPSKGDRCQRAMSSATSRHWKRDRSQRRADEVRARGVIGDPRSPRDAGHVPQCARRGHSERRARKRRRPNRAPVRATAWSPRPVAISPRPSRSH